MAATRVGINFTRYYFYSGNTISPERKHALVALAYATARNLQFAPKAILIRADLHESTTINGQYSRDPKGWHGTFAFKDENQIKHEVHVASHGYTSGKEDFVLKEAVHTDEKNDDHPRGGKNSDKVVWPNNNDLEEYVNSPIAYSHIGENA
ncbi:hypothetical protein LOZ12_006742 [Ophidiomyces ophidiicola]|uniref:Uncharacterized protein n=1 Tax=Ophidiomyces ophidiicola TaxID=1387563 RepID=A0ACB8UM77_9EURO|nr:hypothetical protein LOZ64_006845 [Ophidiomyces ophidiicola]KAI1931876.1 hypothetical protein LOZ62_006767 [Ophidiomyces ophidiicola]KAI1946614.1 hypothetical protein LOZ59_006794 [Ophidiomyces ophidiicola]KAI1961644.1 hypothetical protein LOZ56_006715 [Ophidiomyces ophidiicola]KAI1998828.1 hypothetical protein LOZ50_006815 [Ophidiomyces ophidiicola]